MKVIFEEQLWVVVGDDGEGLFLESMGDLSVRVFAPFSSDQLVVDPTDDEVQSVIAVSSLREPEHG
jgi:hypothetical protein